MTNPIKRCKEVQTDECVLLKILSKKNQNHQLNADHLLKVRNSRIFDHKWILFLRIYSTWSWKTKRSRGKSLSNGWFCFTFWLSFIKSFLKVLSISVHNILYSLMPCSWHQKSNSPILEFKVLQNAFEIKKRGLKYFLK